MPKTSISDIHLTDGTYVEQLLDLDDDAVYFYNTSNQKVVFKVDSSTYCYVPIKDEGYKMIGKIHMDSDYSLYYSSSDSNDKLPLNSKNFMKAEVTLFKHLIENNIIVI